MADMTDAPAKSCRVFVRYGSASVDGLPTEEDIREIFSVHGDIVDVDIRTKFCFVEYDTDTAAQKAVDTENGRDFKGTNLKVEIAVGARKVRNTGNDSSVTVPQSGPEKKKSSFAADEWLAQREATKKRESPGRDEAISSRDVHELSTASNSSFTEQSAGPQLTTTNWQSSRSPSKNRDLSAKRPKLYSRSRSRSPLNNTNSVVEKLNSDKSYVSRSQVEQLRNLEAQLEQQSKWHSASKLSSVDLTKTSAKQSLAYVSEAESTLRDRRSHDRDLPVPAAASSYLRQSPPLKSALKRPTSSSASLETYSTKYGREHDLLGSICEQINRNVDYTLLHMKNASKHVSPPRYDDARESRMELNVRDSHMEFNVPNIRRDNHSELSLTRQRTGADGGVRDSRMEFTVADTRRDSHSELSLTRQRTGADGGVRDSRMEFNVADTRRDSHSELTHQRTGAGGGWCEIFIRTTGHSAYAKHVAVQIEDIGLLVRTTVLSSNADIMDEILDAVNRGCLFALSIAGHDLSTSLYILHGQPEEHRNMLIEDAVAMISQKFAEYRRGRRDRSPSSAVKSKPAADSSSVPTPSAQSSAAVPSLSTVAEHLKPDTVTRRLIGLLSADCELTNSELEHLISYLKLRQKALFAIRQPP